MYISRRKLLMIGVLVVAALTFSIGFAQGNGGIFACVDEEGNLRIVQEGETCGEKENLLVWNREGPQGEPGPQGDQGPPGVMPDDSCPDGQFVTGILDGALECETLPSVAPWNVDSDADHYDLNPNLLPGGLDENGCDTEGVCYGSP